MVRANKKGATFIELIMGILIIAIIATTVAGVIIFFVQLFMYSPRQLDAQKIAQELDATIFEGNQDIRGLRYARDIFDASATQISYFYGYPTSQDGLAVRLRWEATSKHIYRRTSTDSGVTWGTESVIPYYMPSSLTIDGKNIPSVIFTYKKAGDVAWVLGSDPLSDIRRVIMSINLRTGTGSFTDFQGSTNLTASVERKEF